MHSHEDDDDRSDMMIICALRNVDMNIEVMFKTAIFMATGITTRLKRSGGVSRDSVNASIVYESD